MNTIRLRNLILSRIAMASCLSLTASLQGFAELQLAQPNSVVNGTAPMPPAAMEQVQKIIPAGCTDDCLDDSRCSNGCCNGDCCGRCCGTAVCCPKRVTQEVKKHCWKVKSEMICIPSFRFQCNWNLMKSSKSSCDTCCGDSCIDNECGCDCLPNCGRVRCINVLEKHEYTCQECGYEWEVKCVCSGKGCNSNGCCDCPSCGGDGCCTSTDPRDPGVRLTATSEAPSAEEGNTGATTPSFSSRLMSWFK